MYLRYAIVLFERKIEKIWQYIKWFLIISTILYGLYMIGSQFILGIYKSGETKGFMDGRRYERSLQESNKAQNKSLKKNNKNGN